MVHAKYENERRITVFLLSGSFSSFLHQLTLRLVRALQSPSSSGIVWNGSVMVHNKCKMINNKKDDFTFWQGL